MEARVDDRATPQVMRRSRLREGRPHPRGATWTGLGVNFAIFSAHATKVELCLFDDSAEREIERIGMTDHEPNCLVEGLRRVLDREVELHFHKVVRVKPPVQP